MPPNTYRHTHKQRSPAALPTKPSILELLAHLLHLLEDFLVALVLAVDPLILHPSRRRPGEAGHWNPASGGATLDEAACGDDGSHATDLDGRVLVLHRLLL